eukprot:TRINITY_DN9607_c0_g1_i4.p1 TRINITY_DN9607_c0_g1~~TRINITY_DN9607_c0_g1_i4.p1  ORF type:complete len:203 (-),score=42.16 TRINITY_DN9607_c0_g1_i4:134-742(-)
MDCKERFIAEETSKKVFFVAEAVPWASVGDSENFPDPLFARQESVLAQDHAVKKLKAGCRIAAAPQRKSRARRKVALKSKSGVKKGNKRFKEDLYDMSNVVFFDTRAQNAGKPVVSLKTPPKISIPDFKILENTYYEEADVNEILESDGEIHYTEMHRPYELAENCNKFLDNGQGLPEELKGGLKIRIKLPSKAGELPSLIL